MDNRKCKWEHPSCKALGCNGRCVALTDTNFPRRVDCPFYDNNAKFKPTAEQQAEKKTEAGKNPGRADHAEIYHQGHKSMQRMCAPRNVYDAQLWLLAHQPGARRAEGG